MDYPPLDFISQSVAKLTFLNHVDIDLVCIAYKEMSDNGRRKIGHKEFTESVGCEDNNLAKFIFERYHQYEWNDFFQFVIIICFFPGDWFIRYVASFIGIEHDRQELDINEVAALTSLLGNANLIKNANENEKPLEFPLSIIKFEHLLAETPDSIRYLNSLQTSVTSYVFNNTKKAYEIYQRRKRINYKREYVDNHHGELPPLTCKEYMKKIFSKNHRHPYIYDYEITGNSERETLYLVLTYYRNKFSNLCRLKKNSSTKTSSGGTTTPNNNPGNASASRSYRSINKSITNLIAEECSNGIPTSSGGGGEYRVTTTTTTTTLNSLPSSHNTNPLSPAATTTILNNTNSSSYSNSNSNNNNNNIIVPLPTNSSLYTGIKRASVVPISYRTQTACTGCSSRATVNLDPFNETITE